MLAESQFLKEQCRRFDNFELYNLLIESFVNYLRNEEGLSVNLDTEEESAAARFNFSNMPLDVQNAKLDTLLNYYDHCVKLVENGYSLRDNEQSLRGFSFINGLVFPSEDEI